MVIQIQVVWARDIKAAKAVIQIIQKNIHMVIMILVRHHIKEIEEMMILQMRCADTTE